MLISKWCQGAQRIAAVALVTVFAGTAYAGDRFEKPVELKTAGKPFEGILYPSPAIFDIDGDGKKELAIGDLWGHIRVAEFGQDDLSYGEISKLSASGKVLKLNNW